MCSLFHGLLGQDHGFRGTDGTSFWFFLHLEHSFTNFSISESIPGHKRYIHARLLILLIPGCPWYNSNNSCFLPGGGTKTLEPNNIQPFKVDSSDFPLTNCLGSSGHCFGQPFYIYLQMQDKVGSFCVQSLILSPVIGIFSIASINYISSVGTGSTTEVVGLGNLLRASALLCLCVGRNNILYS